MLDYKFSDIERIYDDFILLLINSQTICCMQMVFFNN